MKCHHLSLSFIAVLIFSLFVSGLSGLSGNHSPNLQQMGTRQAFGFHVRSQIRGLPMIFLRNPSAPHWQWRWMEMGAESLDLGETSPCRPTFLEGGASTRIQSVWLPSRVCLCLVTKDIRAHQSRFCSKPREFSRKIQFQKPSMHILSKEPEKKMFGKPLDRDISTPKTIKNQSSCRFVSLDVSTLAELLAPWHSSEPYTRWL